MSLAPCLYLTLRELTLPLVSHLVVLQAFSLQSASDLPMKFNSILPQKESPLGYLAEEIL
jgi:hypothetical protein